MNKQAQIHLVDDDEIILLTLGHVMEKAGYSVLTYDSGPKFLAEFDPNGFGCVILDVMMPEMSGIEVHAELRRLNTAMPVCYMMGDASEPRLNTALKSKPVHVLEKPIPVERLLETIEICLTEEKLRQAELDTK